MSRLFDGVDDQMVYPSPNWQFGTLLVVVKIAIASDTTWLSFLEFETGAGALCAALGRRNNDDIYIVGATLQSGGSITDSDGWMIVAATKATGSVAPDVHKLPIGGARTTNTVGATANGFSSSGGNLRLGGNDDFANIYVAAAACFNGTVLTTTQLDGILAAKTTASIAALSPTWLVDDSDAFATNLINPGTFDRTSITGTTNSADNPSGWVYGLGGGGTTHNPPLGTSVGTGITPAPSTSATPQPGTAPGTGITAAARATNVLGVATATGITPAPAVSATPPAGTATTAGITPAPASTTTPPAGTATATGTAATPSTIATPPMGTAVGAGITPTDSGSTTHTPTIGVATGTGTPPAPSVTATLTPGSSTATGTAPAPTVTVTLTRADATCTGLPPGPSTTCTTTLATATGTGTGPNIAVTVPITHGTATGTGTPPTIISGNIPSAQIHITLQDTTRNVTAQDLGALTVTDRAHLTIRENA